MKLPIFVKVFLVPAVFFSSLAFVQAQNIGSLKDIVPAGFSFKKDLLPGDTDPDVVQLQKVLNADPDTMVSASGDGSIGKESSYFGDKTKQAVIKFQQKYYEAILIPVGLTKGNGNVGKSTRTRLNLLIGVMNTEDSTGRVQSRTAVVVPPAPVITTPQVVQTTNTVTQGAICGLVNLLINIDAISQSNASRALGIFGCASNYSSAGLTPRVDLRVNGSNGPLTFSSEKTVTVSWTSENVTSCQSSRGARDTSGSDRVSVNESGTFVISCSGPYGTVSDSVNVRLRDDDNDDDELSAYCYPSLTSAGLNQPVVWTVTAYGGPSSSYRYSWSGSDSLSGNDSSVTKSYSIAGSKSASVTVRSSDERETISCANVSISTSAFASSTPSNPFTPLANFYYGTGNQGSTSGQASLLINGQTQANVTKGSSYQISYDTAGLTCTATSTQKSSEWKGVLPQRTGSMFIGGNINVSSSDVIIYGPDGVEIERGKVSEGGTQHRFSKPGSQYPNGSTVSVKGAAECYIPNTAVRLTECLPKPQSEIVYSMSCVMPSATSSVSTFYTSTTTNPNLSTTTFPVKKEVVAKLQPGNTTYPFKMFYWKTKSEKDGNLTVIYDSTEEAGEEAGVATDFGGTVVGVGTCDPDDGNHYKDFAVQQDDGSTVVLGWWGGRVNFTPQMGCTILGVGWSKGKPKCTAYNPSEGTIDGEYIGLVYPPTDQDCTGVSGSGKWRCDIALNCYWDPGIAGDGIGPGNSGDAEIYDIDYVEENPNGPNTGSDETTDSSN